MNNKPIGFEDVCYLYKDMESLEFKVVGEEYCKPKHFNGPKIRESYIFSFIVSGKGIFKVHNKTYHLGANQGFLIDDSAVIYYEADKNDPWHYCWIIVNGSIPKAFFDSLSLSSKNPIYTAQNDNTIYFHFKELIEKTKNFYNAPYLSISALYNLFHAFQVFNKKSKKINVISHQEQYAKEARLYIANNYHKENLRIDYIAKELGINRSYLSRLFLQYFGVSPQQYLINFRMEKAKHLIKTTNSPINIIAYSVGYTDIFIFSKMYKKHFGISPKQDRF
jgi:YesN/AraC family two-component response regulator